MITADPRFRSLLRQVTPYRSTLLLALGLMLGESTLSLVSPWIAGLFAETLLAETGEGILSFRQILLLWLLVLAIQAVLSFGNRYLLARTGEAMLARLRARLYDHLQALPLGYFHAHKRGEVLTLMTNDAAVLSGFVTGTLLSLLPQILTLVGALVFIFVIDPFIAGLIGLFAPLFFLAMKVLGRRIRPISRAMMDAYAHTFTIVEENLGMLPVIKSFTREAIESERFRQGNLRLLDETTRFLRVQSLLSPSVQFLAAAGILALLWISAGRMESGELSTANLVSLLLYGMLLTRPLSGLANVYGQIQHARGAAERLIEVFAIEPEPEDEGKPVLPAARGEIEFRRVYFAYPGRQDVLRGLDLCIRAGETVAITGENGVGKSTLAHLLKRFADPREGQILIDGTDIQEVNLASLRSQIGLVQQQVLLLNATVKENIAFGRPGARQEEIRDAAQAAHALDFIERLPDEFDTLIGDQGIRLSGGQKQRLALARALLKDPPILVLDEATAMFDPEGEKGFIEECHELLHQRTVILITHRPASLALADRVLRMEEGRIDILPHPDTPRL